jgi:hypothetical protein
MEAAPMQTLVDTDTHTQPSDPEPPAFATLVATDGTLIKLTLTRFGELVVRVGGREPRVLDRFQVAALRVAMLATADR